MTTDKKHFIVDVECYCNFFLVLFKCIETGEVVRVQISPNRKLNRQLLVKTMNENITIGFNSLNYDLMMIKLAIKGLDTYELKEASDDLIRGMRRGDFVDKWMPPKLEWNHIDLMPIAPGKASLKLYAGRMHCRKLQDLPIDPNKELTAEEAELIVSYCENDLDNTAVMYQELSGQVELRVELSKQYRRDLRSLSDPQVAEAIISAEVAKINKVFPRKPDNVERKFRYQMPEWVRYNSPALRAFQQTMLNTDFEVQGDGSVSMPAALNGLEIRINQGLYRVGIGGLHSSELRISHVMDDDTVLIDRDVASYYPSIILNQRLYPKHLGQAFLTVYEDIVTRRLAAKKAGEKMTAESLKVAINGTFGKLGSMYSVIYSPHLMIQITMTGQIALLMFIEMVEDAGIEVVSANTDGIVIKCPRSRLDDLSRVVTAWEKVTGFQTEETRYKALYSKDVNNYIAVKEDGKTKTKGLYSNPWEVNGPNVFKLAKNPNTTIVVEAVIAYLTQGTPLFYTISRCRDIRKFVSVRTVTGGATQDNEYLGKVVRWYYATGVGRQVINYKKSGYRVPKSDCSKALMELPEKFPDDVNFQWYVEEAKDMLNNIGHIQGRLF